MPAVNFNLTFNLGETNKKNVIDAINKPFKFKIKNDREILLFGSKIPKLFSDYNKYNVHLFFADEGSVQKTFYHFLEVTFADGVLQNVTGNPYNMSLAR
jgi:hypothetical protein